MSATNSDGGTESSPATSVYREVGKYPYLKSLNPRCVCVKPWEELSESFVELVKFIKRGLQVQESLIDP